MSNLKILISDVLLRKSFDVINILLLHFDKQDLIFGYSKHKKLITNLIYSSDSCELLRNDKNFSSDLLYISKKYKSEKIVFLPIEELTIINFYKFISNYGDMNFCYSLPSYESFKLSRNKNELNIFCEKNEIPCPKSISEKDFYSKKFDFPIIVKPKNGSGSNGISFVHNNQHLDNININFERDFIQELLPNAKNVEAGFYLCEKGEIISFYSHKRIRTYPETGGVTVFSEFKIDKKIRQSGAKIIKKLNWSGLLMIEYIFDKRDNQYKLIEINPRLWGSILLSEFSGANFLKSYVNFSLNIKNININYKKNIYIRWFFPYEFIYFFKKIQNPIKFFKLNKNTCYINFTYSNPIKSFVFIILTYFDFSKIKNLFRKRI
jgi:glutathione synthase/RimK-type ligase-like ATP-grasp enzyme